jgi:hypothetical protein
MCTIPSHSCPRLLDYESDGDRPHLTQPSTPRTTPQCRQTLMFTRQVFNVRNQNLAVGTRHTWHITSGSLVRQVRGWRTHDVRIAASGTLLRLHPACGQSYDTLVASMSNCIVNRRARRKAGAGRTSVSELQIQYQTRHVPCFDN